MLILISECESATQSHSHLATVNLKEPDLLHDKEMCVPLLQDLVCLLVDKNCYAQWRIEFKIKHEQETNEKLRQEKVKLRVLAQHRVVEESAAAVLHHQRLIQNKCMKERQFDELCEAKQIMQQEQARIAAISHAARGAWRKSQAELLHDQKLEIRRRREVFCCVCL